MNHRAFIIVAFLLAASTAVADDSRKGGPRGPDIDQLAIVLEMDDYQKQEFERITTEHREAAKARREAMRESGERPDRETMKAAREAMRADLRAQLGTVLTAEQLVKLDALQEMHRDKRPGKNKRSRPADDDADES